MITRIRKIEEFLQILSHTWIIGPGIARRFIFENGSLIETKIKLCPIFSEPLYFGHLVVVLNHIFIAFKGELSAKS